MSARKIVIAPDSFKGTLRATQVCGIWRRAFQKACPEAELVLLPMADGGEGSLEAVLAATGAKSIEEKVADPLGRTVSAHWALLQDGSAFIEAAEANGIERITLQERNPLETTTYGVGQLINAALIDLGFGGVSSDVLEENHDAIINQAIITYCKMNFGLPEDYDRLKRSYDEQKAQLGTATGFTVWGASNV